jgi:V/A-type H+/Na+-transporting ATPase subunit I
MHQVSIIVAKDQLPNFLSYAGREQMIHLVTIEDEQLPSGAAPFEATGLLAKSASIRNRISALATALQPIEGESEKIEPPINNIDEFALFLDKEASRLESSVRELEESQGKLLADKERNLELSRFLSGLEAIGMPLGAIGSSGFLVTLAGECPRESTISVQADLDELTYSNLIFVITHSSEKTQTFLAIFPSAFEDDARKAATALGARVEEPWTNLPADPREAKNLIDGRLGAIEETEKQLANKRESLTKEFGPRVKALDFYADILEARSRAVAGTSTTESTYVLNAWVPATKVRQLAEGASEACEGLVSVQQKGGEENLARQSHIEYPENGLEVQEEDQPPTLVSSPNWTKPLQSLIDSFGIPSYDETNPLVFMILTFPLMYGLMFGDFGEGPLMLLLGLVLLRLKKKGKKVGDFVQPFVSGAELIVMLGVATTVFGLVFGDFFGFESKSVFGFAGIFSPTKGAIEGDIANLQLFMVFILFLGVVHMTFGMGLGAYNRLRRHEFREAFFGPICSAWFYVAGVSVISQVALSGFKFSVALQNPAEVPAVFIPLLLLGWKEGGLHAMEVFIQSISNTFSYLRIWALNLSGYYVKFAIFVALGGPAITAFSLLGATAGNLLVMILEGLIVFVQALRLHWVEWFGKFYEGGGTPFSPYREPLNWPVS